MVAEWPTPGRYSELSQMLARVLNLTWHPIDRAADENTGETNDNTGNKADSRTEKSEG